MGFYVFYWIPLVFLWFLLNFSCVFVIFIEFRLGFYVFYWIPLVFLCFFIEFHLRLYVLYWIALGFLYFLLNSTCVSIYRYSSFPSDISIYSINDGLQLILGGFLAARGEKVRQNKWGRPQFAAKKTPQNAWGVFLAAECVLGGFFSAPPVLVWEV